MLKIKVTQGRAESESEHNGQGLSITEVIAEAMGYATVELESVIVSYQSESTTRFDVAYQLGKGTGLFHASITVVNPGAGPVR